MKVTCEKHCIMYKVMLLESITRYVRLPGWLRFLRVALYFYGECDFYNITFNKQYTQCKMSKMFMLIVSRNTSYNVRGIIKGKNPAQTDCDDRKVCFLL